MIIGLVICGGQSTRMGSDKGLLIHNNNVTWAQHCFSLLAQLEVQVAISINTTQHDNYKRTFPVLNLVEDDAKLNIHGPLLGLLSVHLKYPTEDVFVLACDMIKMDPGVLRHLHNYYLENEPKKTCVFTHNKFFEPLCAIYTHHDLNSIHQWNQKGQLEKHSLKFCLERLDVRTLAIPVEWKDYFRNFNTGDGNQEN